MNHTTGIFTATDGTKLFTQTWLPDGSPAASLFLAHGYAEHSGRYAHVAEYMAGCGYAVYAMDHRGHGRSEGLRAHIDSYETILADMYAYFSTIKPVKCFAIGHSMGGALALAFTARHQDELRGVITSGAALNAGAAVPRYLIALSNILSVLVPKMPIMALEASVVSKDPKVQEAYNADPLNYRGKVRARMGQQIMAVSQDVRRNAGKITVPALVMHGGDDRLIDPSSAKAIHDLLGSKDKTLRVYEGLYHEICNEPERETVLADIAAWIKAHA